GSTGLVFMHARYYDARLGRFISADTVVPGPGNPQDLNRYAYVRNNPLNYTDPSGHRACLDEECNWVENPVSGEIIWRGPGAPPSSALPKDLLAPLEPDHPTGLPPVVDWLAQPLLHIWPRVKFYESGVRFSGMLGETEIECGIKDDARLLTDSPFLVSPSATRVYLPGGLWLETESDGFLPGRLTLGGTSARVRGSYRGVSVQARSVSRVMMSVTDPPGVLRVGTGVELPIVAQGEGIGSVRGTPYMRVSTNVYGTRALALAVDAAVVYGIVTFGPPVIGIVPVAERVVTLP
ncbi:MAG: RHS repeat-associated core domain-containing protein, partial [Anaerolineae bacterium]